MMATQVAIAAHQPEITSSTLWLSSCEKSHKIAPDLLDFVARWSVSTPTGG